MTLQFTGWSPPISPSQMNVCGQWSVTNTMGTSTVLLNALGIWLSSSKRKATRHTHTHTSCGKTSGDQNVGHNVSEDESKRRQSTGH